MSTKEQLDWVSSESSRTQTVLCTVISGSCHAGQMTSTLWKWGLEGVLTLFCFPVGAGLLMHAHTLVQQTLYPLRHLPGPLDQF